MKLNGLTVVYGGSFNPPHMGHQMACLYLLEALGADTVWLMPAAHHPFGKSLTSFDHRVAMCRIAAAPFGARVEVSEVEAEPGATGRTYDSLVTLGQRNPEVRLGFAVGSDILRETADWHRWDDIRAMVTVVVMARAGYPEPTAGRVELPEVSSGEVRRLLCEASSIAGLVPVGVAAYIEGHGLYGR
jgi:nicotinate-nucleotide adenylyltransferase